MNSPISVPRFFYSNNFSRCIHAFKRKRSKPLPRRQSFLLEPLESRLLLSVGLIGVPNWDDQGPGPNINGQDENVPGETTLAGNPPNPVSGAIQALAIHP